MPGASGVVSPYQRPTPVKVKSPDQYLPGTFVQNPNYDEATALQRQRELRNNQERDLFAANAMNNVPWAMSYTDPFTGLSMQYPNGGRAGAAGSARGGELEDFDFSAALAKARTAMPGKLAPAKMPDRVVGATPADAAAAQASEFARAKDRIGKLGRGSMMALQENLDARGMGGAGYEADATANVLNEVTGQTGEVIRDQAIQNLVRQRQVEDRNYAGDINQRGQDIGFTTTTRGQDANYELGRHQMLVPLMSLIAENRKRRLY